MEPVYEGRQKDGVPALVLAIAFDAVGVYMVEVGRVMWTDSHNPRTVAQIDSRRCWTSTGSDGSENLCDLVVTYSAVDWTVTTRMKAVDAGGIHRDKISVSYSPVNVSDASGPENNSQTACMLWGFAILLIAFEGWLIRAVLRQRSQRGHPGRPLHVHQAPSRRLTQEGLLKADNRP
jgi:hypothetical protein